MAGHKNYDRNTLYNVNCKKIIGNNRNIDIKSTIFPRISKTSKFGEFISPAEVALVCLKFILSFIKFCSLVT